jgi:GTP pyrophosphokinase
MNMNPERRIDVDWNEEISESYPVKIQITSQDRVGLLADLTSIISKSKANIMAVNSKTGDNKIAESQFTIAVKNTEHLNRLMSDIRKIKAVMDIRRLEH